MAKQYRFERTNRDFVIKIPLFCTRIGETEAESRIFGLYITKYWRKNPSLGEEMGPEKKPGWCFNQRKTTKELGVPLGERFPRLWKRVQRGTFQTVAWTSRCLSPYFLSLTNFKIYKVHNERGNRAKLFRTRIHGRTPSTTTAHSRNDASNFVFDL